MNLENTSFYANLVSKIKKDYSFTLTGLTSFSKLLLIKYILKISGKKVLFLTSTEQAAIKYSSDLERIFGLESSILPYQNISPYEVLSENLYDYARQTSIIFRKPEIVITPIKSMLEKFPKQDFFDNNSFELEIGESIEQKELLYKLINLGYKRSTMVTDIGEFSIRGDIADIYTLNDNPIRLEFWGDEIVDIRFFNT